MRAEDMFVLDAAGEVLHTPEARPPPHKPPKLSECAPLFMSVRAQQDKGSWQQAGRACWRWWFALGTTRHVQRQRNAAVSRLAPRLPHHPAIPPAPARRLSCGAHAPCCTATP